MVPWGSQVFLGVLIPLWKGYFLRGSFHMKSNCLVLSLWQFLPIEKQMKFISASSWFYPGLVGEMTVSQFKSSESDPAVILSPIHFSG